MEGIEEHFGCFFKSDPMLLHIDGGFVFIPLKFDALKSVYDIHETISRIRQRKGQIQLDLSTRLH